MSLNPAVSERGAGTRGRAGPPQAEHTARSASELSRAARPSPGRARPRPRPRPARAGTRRRGTLLVPRLHPDRPGTPANLARRPRALGLALGVERWPMGRWAVGRRIWVPLDQPPRAVGGSWSRLGVDLLRVEAHQAEQGAAAALLDVVPGVGPGDLGQGLRPEARGDHRLGPGAAGQELAECPGRVAVQLGDGLAGPVLDPPPEPSVLCAAPLQQVVCGSVRGGSGRAADPGVGDRLLDQDPPGVVGGLRSRSFQAASMASKAAGSSPGRMRCSWGSPAPDGVQRRPWPCRRGRGSKEEFSRLLSLIFAEQGIGEPCPGATSDGLGARTAPTILINLISGLLVLSPHNSPPRPAPPRPRPRAPLPMDPRSPCGAPEPGPRAGGRGNGTLPRSSALPYPGPARGPCPSGLTRTLPLPLATRRPEKALPVWHMRFYSPASVPRTAGAHGPVRLPAVPYSGSLPCQRFPEGGPYLVAMLDCHLPRRLTSRADRHPPAAAGPV